MTARENTPMPIASQAIAQILRAMFPPTALVHVGWGNGLGDLTQWTEWQVPHAFVIEAEEKKLAACQAQALTFAHAAGQPNPAWQTIHATLSAQNLEQPYHLASNPSESGLLPPDSLQHAWPHLQTVATQTVVTRSLDELWQDISPKLPLLKSAHNTWLIIDCLPAADILSSGVSTLQAAQVVCARSLLANRAALCDQMRAAGWIEAAWAESQHPAFGHAWFTRDTALELDNAANCQAQLLAERDEQKKVAEQALVNVETLTEQRDLYLSQRGEFNHVRVVQQTQLEALEKAIADAQAQLGIKSQAQSDLQDQLNAVTQAQVDLQSQLDSAAKRQTELAAERDALAQSCASETQAKELALRERDGLAQAKTALQTQLEALEKAMADAQAQLGINSQEQSDLQGQLNAITQAQVDLQSKLESAVRCQAELLAERDEQKKVAEQALVNIETLTEQRDLYLSQRDELNHVRVVQRTQLEALEQEIQLVKAEKKSLHDTNEDLISRIRLMEDEISRTEGQIELIKDLMLSDGRQP
jgi:hypothetical protein